MNRREAFKLFAVGAVSLLGAKGLVDKLRERFSPYWPKPVIVCEKSLDVLRPVMGEQAHWPEGMELPHVGHLHARVVAAKIDGEWVDTSDWAPEQIAAIEPGVLKQAPADGIKKTPIPVEIGKWGMLDG